MDSQLTLVNSSQPISLVFDSYSVRDARISLSTDTSNTLYTLRTADSAATAGATSYLCSGERKLAAIQQNEVLPDRVVFYEANGEGKTKVSVNKWLKKGTLPDKYPVRFMSFGGSLYYWKSDKNFRLALYNSNYPDQPIATYTAPKGRTISPIVIAIVSEREMLLNRAPEVLSAFILLESKMRRGENQNDTKRGAGFGQEL